MRAPATCDERLVFEAVLGQLRRLRLSTSTPLPSARSAPAALFGCEGDGLHRCRALRPAPLRAPPWKSTSLGWKPGVSAFAMLFESTLCAGWRRRSRGSRAIWVVSRTLIWAAPPVIGRPPPAEGLAESAQIRLPDLHVSVPGHTCGQAVGRSVDNDADGRERGEKLASSTRSTNSSIRFRPGGRTTGTWSSACR